MDIRVITGEYKHRKLSAPPGVRPTKCVVREALCSIVFSHNGFRGKCFLELCCGSGIVGIEALSNGAEHVTFVDNADLMIVRDNAARLGCAKKCTFIQADMKDNIELPHTYDLVFIDPPYHLSNLIPKTLENTSYYLSGGAIVFIESEKTYKTPELKHYDVLKEKIYGNTKLTLCAFTG